MEVKKKILYIITKQDIGGAQKYVKDLASNIDKNRFEAKIVYGGIDARWLSNKVMPYFLFFNDWLAIGELVKIFIREKPDIIHLNSSKVGIIGTLAAKIYSLFWNSKIKVIFTAHGWIFNPTNDLNFFSRMFFILLHKIAAFFQDRIINVSEYDFELARKYRIAPLRKLAVIHNGIDSNINFLDRETARKELSAKISSKFQLDKNTKLVGSIGRLTKEKNYFSLIEAAALAPDISFAVIGSGPEHKNLIRRVADENPPAGGLKERFFIVEPTGEDAKYLKAFDVFVLPSVKEGLPYTLLEAMAAEIPIIATKVGGIPEILREECGLLVSPRNPQELADGINKYQRDFFRRFSSKAKDKLRKEFDLKAMIDKTEEIYLN